MKILSLFLVVVGIALIGFGLYNVVFPQEILDVGLLQVKESTELNTQYLAMIGLGVLALIAGVFLTKKR